MPLTLDVSVNSSSITKINDNEKDEDKMIFWLISIVFNLKYLNQNLIKSSMFRVFRNPHDEQILTLLLGFWFDEDLTKKKFKTGVAK